MLVPVDIALPKMLINTAQSITIKQNYTQSACVS